MQSSTSRSSKRTGVGSRPSAAAAKDREKGPTSSLRSKKEDDKAGAKRQSKAVVADRDREKPTRGERIPAAHAQPQPTVIQDRADHSLQKLERSPAPPPPVQSSSLNVVGGDTPFSQEEGTFGVTPQQSMSFTNADRSLSFVQPATALYQFPDTSKAQFADPPPFILQHTTPTPALPMPSPTQPGPLIHGSMPSGQAPPVPPISRTPLPHQHHQQTVSRSQQGQAAGGKQPGIASVQPQAGRQPNVLPQQMEHRAGENPTGLDVTVLAFAQWLSEARSSHKLAQQHLVAEVLGVRTAIVNNSQELADFKRHSGVVLGQIQTEISDCRARLSELLEEVTSRARQFAASDAERRRRMEDPQEALARLAASSEELRAGARESHRQTHRGVELAAEDAAAFALRSEGLAKLLTGVEGLLEDRGGAVQRSLDFVYEERKSQTLSRASRAVRVGEDLDRLRDSVFQIEAELGSLKRATLPELEELRQSVAGLPDPPLPPGGLEGEGGEGALEGGGGEIEGGADVVQPKMNINSNEL